MTGDLTKMPRPRRLLTQNKRLRKDGIWNWTLPALAARLPDGRTVATCPSAGVCAQICYARNGTYMFRNVRERHLANLAYVLDDLEGWERVMIAELGRFRGKAVRIHDSGDFFSDAYTRAWRRVIQARPNVFFYAYTKEVERARRLLLTPAPPPNFGCVFSLGGRQDHTLTAADRVADVFPTEQAITDAGWHSQAASDLLAVTGPAPVGMAANTIPRFQRLQGNRTLREWQESVDARRRDQARAAPEGWEETCHNQK